jgi:hypothetical protein
VVRTLDKDGYRIAIHELVPRRTPFERRDPFVQIKWEPAAKLPPRIADEIDLDGDGQADARVTFDVPSDAAAPLRAKIEGLTTRVRSVEEVRQQSFSCLIARVNDAILVRVPLR